MIFETERLIVRKLITDDLEAYHEMQSNPKVMRYVTGEVKNKLVHKKEIEDLILKYNDTKNDFWIYAIERKKDATFLGTVALVKDGEDDEIGYRFLEKHWENGYGTEGCLGLIEYAKNIGLPKLIAYVIHKNKASSQIIKKHGFKSIKETFCKFTGLPETKYELGL